MSWAIGFDSHWARDVGYGVPATCDYPGCGKEINRGLGHVCCDQKPYGGENGCGLYFCDKHLGFKCEHDGLEPTPDLPKWIRWKLADESWKRWRDENPEEVKALKAQLPAPPVMMSVIVAVSGGRDYTDKGKVWSVLDELHAARTIELLIQGQCYKGGADKLAEDWAQSREVNCMSVPAKTKRHGFKAAGPIRNGEMGSMKPDVWVLFPGGRGTDSARSVAQTNGIEIIEVAYT